MINHIVILSYDDQGSIYWELGRSFSPEHSIFLPQFFSITFTHIHYNIRLKMNSLLSLCSTSDPHMTLAQIYYHNVLHFKMVIEKALVCQ